MTGNIRDNCYSHIPLLPTHLRLASADFVHLLSIATFADLRICLLPIADFICCCINRLVLYLLR